MYLQLSIGSGGISLLLTLLWLLRQQRQRRLQERMDAVLASSQPLDAGQVDALVEEAEGRSVRLLEPLTGPLAALLPARTRGGLRARLTRAGLEARVGEGDLLLLYLLGLLAGGAAAFFSYRWLAEVNAALALPAAALAAFVLAVLPEYWLQSRVNRRQYRVRRTLPDALDLLVVSVEAGTGFEAALARVEEKFHGPLAEEFRRALQEIRLGKSRAAALRSLAERTGLPEMTTFVAAVCQADQLGVGLARVLRVQAETVRQRRLYQIREVAQKLPVKMLFPLVFCIFPALFVVIVGAGMLRIYEALAR